MSQTAGMNRHDHRLGVLALLCAALIFGSYGPLIREMSATFGDTSQVIVRVAIGFAIASVLVLRAGRKVSFSRTSHFRLAGLGAALTGIYLFTTLAVAQTKIANATFLLYAGGIFTGALIGFTFFRERIDAKVVLAIGLAIAGLAVYNGPTIAIEKATVFGLLAGCCIALTGMFRKLLKNEDRLHIVWASLGYSCVLSLPLLAISSNDLIREFDVSAIVATVVLGILVVTQSQLVTFGYSHLNLSSGSVILSTEVVFGGLFGWIGYSETPTAAEFAGASLVFIAAAVMALRKPALQPAVVNNPG